MQHFRKVTTLAEDFAAMGLAEKQSDYGFFPKETADSNEVAESVEEALTVQRTQKMSPGEKAKARRYRTKNKAKLSRQKAVRDRKPQTQLRKDRQAKLKGDRTAGPRRRFVLSQDMSNMREQMKALQELRTLHTANNGKKIQNKHLVESLERIISNAQILCRKYAVLEEIKSGSLRESVDVPVEYPGLSVDWENPDAPNIKPTGKDMDATDYAKDSKLAGNVKEDDMDPSDNQEWWVDVDSDDDGECGDVEVDMDDMDDSGDLDVSMDDGDMSMDDGDMSMDDADSDEMGDSEDDEIELDFSIDDEEEMAMESKRVDLSYEMAKLRTEAEDVLAKMKTSVLSPADAASIVKDMVVYLGGAMKAYIDLAAQVSNQYQQGGYAGQGQPNDETAAPEDNKNVNKYAGQEAPPEAGHSPEIFKLK